MSNALKEAQFRLCEQLNWRGPSGKCMGIVTLTRDQAVAILDGPTDPVAVLDEIARLAMSISRKEIEKYAEAGGMWSALGKCKGE